MLSTSTTTAGAPPRRPTARRPVTYATVLAALLSLAAGSFVPRTAAAAPTVIATFESSGSGSSGSWQTFDFSVPESTEITITADWTGTGDVDLFLRRNGNGVANANGNARPEVLTYDAAAGAYNLAVQVDGGNAAYEVEVVADLGGSAPPPPSGDGQLLTTIRSSGDQSQGRWQTFPLDVPSRGDVTVSATWNGNGDVRLFLRDGRDTLASVSSGSQPRSLTETLGAGDYEIAVLIKTGSADYVVEARLDGSGSTPSPDPEPDPDPAPAPSGAYPGRPANGRIYWGASIKGNADPYDAHERQANHPMTLRRTFFQWSQRTGSLLNIARDDARDGRLSWVSLVPPSWTSMANGNRDAEIDQLLRGLDDIDGPVWLTIHHEPEGGGGNNNPEDPSGPSGHLAMNRRVRQRMDRLGVDNVALVPIFMAWTFNPASGRRIDDWWANGVYDFVGVDIYNTEGGPIIGDNWYRVRQWARDKGVDVAVGEWGMLGTNQAAGERVRDWYDHAARSGGDGRGARVVGLAAFDSDGGDRVATWELRGEQLEAFRDLFRDSRTADPRL